MCAQKRLCLVCGPPSHAMAMVFSTWCLVNPHRGTLNWVPQGNGGEYYVKT